MDDQTTTLPDPATEHPRHAIERRLAQVEASLIGASTLPSQLEEIRQLHKEVLQAVTDLAALSKDGKGSIDMQLIAVRADLAELRAQVAYRRDIKPEAIQEHNQCAVSG